MHRAFVKKEPAAWSLDPIKDPHPGFQSIPGFHRNNTRLTTFEELKSGALFWLEYRGKPQRKDLRSRSSYRFFWPSINVEIYTDSCFPGRSETFGLISRDEDEEDKDDWGLPPMVQTNVPPRSEISCQYWRNGRPSEEVLEKIDEIPEQSPWSLVSSNSAFRQKRNRNGEDALERRDAPAAHNALVTQPLFDVDETALPLRGDDSDGDRAEIGNTPTDRSGWSTPSGGFDDPSDEFTSWGAPTDKFTNWGAPPDGFGQDTQPNQRMDPATVVQQHALDLGMAPRGESACILH